MAYVVEICTTYHTSRYVGTDLESMQKEAWEIVKDTNELVSFALYRYDNLSDALNAVDNG